MHPPSAAAAVTTTIAMRAANAVDLGIVGTAKASGNKVEFISRQNAHNKPPIQDDRRINAEFHAVNLK